MKFIPNRNRLLRSSWLCCAALLLRGLTPTLSAQRVSPGGTATGPEGATAGSTVTTDANVAERVIVQDVPIEESILPTTRPYTAAFGLEDNILDVPRNVTIISREQLDTIDISSVRDFSKLTSSSFTTTNFGAPANPSLRGTTADVLLNGQRRGLTSNGNGLPLDFNEVESVSILKGPPPAIYGASQYVGGFIDLVTKRPYFDKFQGSVSGTVGLYDQNRYTLDFGGPIIKDILAYRISYSGEESGSFYENGNQSTQSVYGALTWIPTAKYKLEANASFFQADYTENFGVNRPTQALIDHGRYTTGSVIDENGDGLLNKQDVNYFNVSPTPILGSNGQPLTGNPFTPTGTIDLNRSRRLLRPGDGSFGREVEGQVIQTLVLDDHLTLVNNLYANYIKRDTRSSYYYSEVIDNDYVIDDRTELQGKYETTVGGGLARTGGPSSKDAKDAKQVAAAMPGGGIKLIDEYNAGIDIRYQHTLAYDDYFNEPSNSWDLSGNRQNIALVNFVADLPIPGHPGRFATPGAINGDTGDTNTVQGGVFLQNEFRFGPAALLTGGRGDFLYTHWTDPVTFGGKHSDDTVTVIPDANISLTYDITPKVTAYATFNYSQYTHVGVGGGLTPGSGYQYSANDFHNESFLEEGGIKASLLKDTLFLNFAGFHQTRGFSGAGGAIVPIDAKGIEIEGNWQPNKNFYLTAGYTLTEAFLYHQSPGFVSQLAPIDKLPVNSDGTITLDSGGNLPVGTYRQPGLPEHLVNLLATYKFNFGLGASLGTIISGPIHSDYTGDLKIPWQYTMDLTVFYTYKRYEARIAFLNLTDQDNWAPPNPVYGDGSILRDLPFRVEATFKIRF